MARRIDFYDDPAAPGANSMVPSVNVVVTNDGGDVLLIRRSDNQNWAVPGGAIDLGESMVQAGVRETREESGIDCSITGLAGIYTDPKHVLLTPATARCGRSFPLCLLPGLLVCRRPVPRAARCGGVPRASLAVRIALGDPGSRRAAGCGEEEGIGGALPAASRRALEVYGPLNGVENVEIRLHRTVLYNSIYRADDQLLVNQHAHGIPAGQTPVFCLRKSSGGEMAALYFDSFERVWASATPLA